MALKKQRIKLGKFKYILIGILAIFLLFMIGSLILKYRVTPPEAYLISTENHIEDGGFENFNQTVGDCCNAKPELSKVYTEKSTNSFEGQYSLKLSSENQCACINKKVTNFSNTNLYFISFSYLGTNPRTCNWVAGTDKCLPEKKFNSSILWQRYNYLFSPSEKSQSSAIYFYTDSSGEPKTNYYDDLQVRQLVEIPVKGPFSDDQEYVIKAKVDNNVNGEKISDEVDGEAYFYVAGKPMVTIKFPYSDLVIILVIIFIIARLILTKGKEEWE